MHYGSPRLAAGQAVRPAAGECVCSAHCSGTALHDWASLCGVCPDSGASCPTELDCWTTISVGELAGVGKDYPAGIKNHRERRREVGGEGLKMERVAE